ncbi:MAG: MBL fold metallo-hydrolase [Ruminococcaceae bacterium]|nr:MBL fold metallo-hydrolase [Oscillospiraceae bacterium]
MKKLRVLLSVFLAVMFCFFAGCTQADNQNGSSSAIEVGFDAESQNLTQTEGNGEIKIHYIDVGQGDSIFIELTNDRVMLIDAGESEYSSTVINYIKNLRYNKIDYLVATHPHSDHIGGMEKVINAFTIGEIYMPKIISNTKTFESLLETIKNKGLKINSADYSVKIINDNNLKAEFLSPVKDKYGDTNDYSAVLKLTYKDNKFLFMGDAETEAEDEISADVTCDIIKVGHHGSNSSSGKKFVKKTKAKYAVISCGTDNKYGHPHTEIVKRWEDSGAKIYRTDLSGTVIVTSDGKTINVTATKTQNSIVQSTPSSVTENTQQKYILNTSTKKIHIPSCSYVSKMKDSNKTESSEKIEKIISNGYSKCKVCLGD